MNKEQRERRKRLREKWTWLKDQHGLNYQVWLERELDYANNITAKVQASIFEKECEASGSIGRYDPAYVSHGEVIGPNGEDSRDVF